VTAAGVPLTQGSSPAPGVPSTSSPTLTYFLKNHRHNRGIHWQRLFKLSSISEFLKHIITYHVSPYAKRNTANGTVPSAL